MHHRSGSWVKGHYRKGTWIAGHSRKGTCVSDYTKNSYSRYVHCSSNKTSESLHLSAEERRNRDRNIYVTTVLEREKRRIKPPVYETYFRGSFEEELAYNRSHRLWSFSSNSVDIAEKYLGRLIRKDKAKFFKIKTAEEYDKYVSEYNQIPLSCISKDSKKIPDYLNPINREKRRRKREVSNDYNKTNNTSFLTKIKSFINGI